MRTLLLALSALVLAGTAAQAGERSYGFVHVGHNGSISQSLSSGLSSRRTALSSVSYSDDRPAFRNRDRQVRSDHGFRDIARSGAHLRPRGSFLYVSRSVNPVDRPYIPSLDDVAYGGSGTYSPDSGRAWTYGRGYADAAPAPSFPSGARIIHIDSERLDRQPIGPSGIQVISTGGAKIIRIAPGYSSTGQRQASAEPAAQRETSYLSPWSEAWMTHCIKRFDSFNPQLGTYRDASGKTRFCTADE